MSAIDLEEVLTELDLDLLPFALGKNSSADLCRAVAESEGGAVYCAKSDD